MSLPGRHQSVVELIISVPSLERHHGVHVAQELLARGDRIKNGHARSTPGGQAEHDTSRYAASLHIHPSHPVHETLDLKCRRPLKFASTCLDSINEAHLSNLVLIAWHHANPLLVPGLCYSCISLSLSLSLCPFTSSSADSCLKHGLQTQPSQHARSFPEDVTSM